MAPGKSVVGSRALAAIPLVVGLVLGLLLLPRPIPPGDVPLPRVDARALERTEAQDDADAQRAQKTPLPAVIRGVGSALRAFMKLQAEDGASGSLEMARKSLDATLGEATREAPPEALRVLRAVQLAAFLREVEHFERTGEETSELRELAGAFVRRFRRAGWIRGRKVLLDASERRVVFKMAWTSVLGLEGAPALAATLDEQRVLFRFYLARPHAPEAVLAQIELARESAKDAAACAALDAGERMAREGWRIDKIRKFAALEPTYPAAYALGIAHFRRGAYPAAAQAFRDWVDAHPDGPYTLRAKNFLRAAVAADTSVP